MPSLVHSITRSSEIRSDECTPSIHASPAAEIWTGEAARLYLLRLVALQMVRISASTQQLCPCSDIGRQLVDFHRIAILRPVFRDRLNIFFRIKFDINSTNVWNFIKFTLQIESTVLNSIFIISFLSYVVKLIQLKLNEETEIKLLLLTRIT